MFISAFVVNKRVYIFYIGYLPSNYYLLEINLHMWDEKVLKENEKVWDERETLEKTSHMV